MKCAEEKMMNKNKVEGKNTNKITNTNSITNSNTNTITNSNQNSLNVHEKIFVSEKFLKSRKNINHQSGTVVNPSAEVNENTKNDAVDSSSSVSKSSNLMAVANKAAGDVDLADLKLGRGPIFHQTWVRFFKYTDQDLQISTPKNFYRNNEFFNQVKFFPNANLNQKGKDLLYDYIHEKSFFYVNVFRTSINFITSRQIQLQKTFDTLNIDDIKPIMETPGFTQGGILDFGNYNEGFCFKVIANKPKMTNWVICTESMEEKNSFMIILKKLKLQMQRDQGNVLVPQVDKKKETLSDVMNPNQGGSKNLKQDGTGNLGVSFGANEKLTDGYWIVLQEWTCCSLKCGGGTQTLQRMCVPPKSGGKPCQGEPILTRKCNTQACPNILETQEKNRTKIITMKPVVKVMPFTTRPQRYTKCVIKEGDLMFSKDAHSNENNNNPDLEAKIPKDMPTIQIPTRVVMNNRTVTIFAGEEYNSLIMSFNLDTTEFYKSKKKESCFVLQENKNKRAELCPFGCDNVSKAVEEWYYDFSLFKNQCRTPPDVLEFDHQFQLKLDEKIRNAKKQLLEEREKEIKKRVLLKEKKELEGILKKTNDVALQAIKKEMNLEEMIKQEEAEREARIELEIREKIEQEKRKSDCILKAIKERKLENQFNLKAAQTEEEINKIKKTTTQQVIIRRSQLKDAIMKMRKKSERRQRSLRGELHTVRMSVASEMGKAYRKGDAGKCVNSLKSKENRQNYCIANFHEDYSAQQNCIEGEDFCYVCCDAEFGDFYAVERQKCYQAICKLTSPTGGAHEEEKGRWIWQTPIDDFSESEKAYEPK